MEENLFIFEKLEVYRIALKFTEKVHSITQETRSRFHWTDQFNRAATSIVLNLAEGAGKKNPKEKRNFYNISQGSVFECVPLIELGISLRLLTEGQRTELRDNCISIAKMLTKLIQSLEGRCKP